MTQHQDTQTQALTRYIDNVKTQDRAMADALLAVDNLHLPVEDRAGRFECDHCADPQDGLWRLPYPCPTIKAIHDALGISD